MPELSKPTNPWLYPWDGPRMGVSRHHNPRTDGTLLIDVLDAVRQHSRAQLSGLLRQHGYGAPSGAALARMDETIHHDMFQGEGDEPVRRVTVLRFEFPTGPKDGEQIAILDAFWNRRFVSPEGPITSVAGRLAGGLFQPMPLFLDLATGHWCAFDHDTALGGPLGTHYVHDSPATRYPQPEAPHAHP